ncbi:MAG: type I secretion system permease/ATPase, partial [Planctomycetes bacterium]|nr:type I secretion system permease/ATPase [Planctomycetota bacterium]
MPHSTESNRQDTGLACLVRIARFHQIAADPQQIAHEHGAPSEHFEADSLVRAGRRLGFKAQSVSSQWDRLKITPLPAIAQHTDGHFVILAGFQDDRVLIQDPLEPRPLTLPRAIFEEAWSGRLILITRRASLKDLGGKFGFGWFIPAIVKYRKLFAEVLAASFFLQLFALV